MLRKVSKNAIMPFLTLPPPFVTAEELKGAKAALSMELARLTFDGAGRHDLDLGGGVWATKHF